MVVVVAIAILLVEVPVVAVGVTSAVVVKMVQQQLSSPPSIRTCPSLQVTNN
jgi:hypothetical protein